MDESNTNRALITGLLIATAAALVALVALTYQHGRTSQLHDMRQVATICHTHNTKACQQAMERTHTEYICNTNGNCWVEVK